MPQRLATYLTEAALGQRRPSLASCFLGELIHRPTGRWSFPKRGLPPSFRSPDSMALREEGKAPSPEATAMGGWGGPEEKMSSGPWIPRSLRGRTMNSQVPGWVIAGLLPCFGSCSTRRPWCRWPPLSPNPSEKGFLCPSSQHWVGDRKRQEETRQEERGGGVL